MVRNITEMFKAAAMSNGSTTLNAVPKDVTSSPDEGLEPKLLTLLSDLGSTHYKTLQAQCVSGGVFILEFLPYSVDRNIGTKDWKRCHAEGPGCRDKMARNITQMFKSAATTKVIPVPAPARKGKLCRNVNKKGGCPFGEACTFAHPGAALDRYDAHLSTVCTLR
jgi:hypothetical protein